MAVQPILTKFALDIAVAFGYNNEEANWFGNAAWNSDSSCPTIKARSFGKIPKVQKISKKYEITS